MLQIYIGLWLVPIPRWTQLGHGITHCWNSNVRTSDLNSKQHQYHHTFLTYYTLLSFLLYRILWPFDADQPGNAANVSITHNAGYELYEVRNGLGLRPLHRLGDKAPEGTVEAVRREIREVLDKARGDDGKIKRENARKISVKFSEMWDEENGSGWKDLKKIVEGL